VKKVFGIDLKSERSQRLISYLVLFTGVVVVAGGVFGIWMQGRTMYNDMPLHVIYDVLCPEDVYLSICLASSVTSVGILLLSWVILASKLTEKFSATKRNVLFASFAIVLLTAIMVASKIATDQDWARAKAATDEYFKNQLTNAPASSPVKTESSVK